jgi:hypothetical protein
LKNIQSKYHQTKLGTPVKKHKFMPRLKSANMKVIQTPVGKDGYAKINVRVDSDNFNKIKDTTINFSRLNEKLERIE